MDLFIMLISLALSARFKQVGKLIRFLISNNVLDENIWEKIRKDYTRLVILCERVDKVMSNLVVVSFGNNIFIILVQLFNSLETRPRFGILDKLYYVYSFAFLIIRLVLVALFASTISSESKKPRYYLASIPTSIYNVQIERFLQQVRFNKTALTGHKIFRITRNLILRISLAIVSYELVLIQFIKFDED